MKTKQKKLSVRGVRKPAIKWRLNERKAMAWWMGMSNLGFTFHLSYADRIRAAEAVEREEFLTLYSLASRTLQSLAESDEMYDSMLEEVNDFDKHPSTWQKRWLEVLDEIVAEGNAQKRLLKKGGAK